ncbi:unnamed protein product, partial [marine sediment metagenome]
MQRTPKSNTQLSLQEQFYKIKAELKRKRRNEGIRALFYSSIIIVASWILLVNIFSDLDFIDYVIVIFR